MADPEHLERLHDVAAWNEWRTDNPEVRPNLSRANLSGADLSVAYLSGANLTEADLSGANLSGADLSGADLSVARLFRANLSGANLSGANLSGANLTVADLSVAYLSGANLTEARLIGAVLSGAVLSGAVLSGANLSGANLSGANLSAADLSAADLTEADLSRANLTEANLTEAKLTGADLTVADLSGADLSGANLTEARLTDAHLDGARLDGARLGWSIFANVDLSAVVNLEQADHLGPSSVGVDTLYRSNGQIPSEFLRSCGVPNVMVEYIPSLTAAAALTFYSAFISYSHADSDFARQLHGDLFHQHQVPAWLDEHALAPGDKLDVEIDKAIRSVDKIVLICSEAVLSGPTGSWWVDREVARALQEEERLSRQRNEHVNMVIPVDLDGYLFSDDCTYHRAADLRERVVQSFDGWSDDDDVYRAGLDRVLRALRPNRAGTIIPPRQI